MFRFLRVLAGVVPGVSVSSVVWLDHKRGTVMQCANQRIQIGILVVSSSLSLSFLACADNSMMLCSSR